MFEVETTFGTQAMAAFDTVGAETVQFLFGEFMASCFQYRVVHGRGRQKF